MSDSRKISLSQRTTQEVIKFATSTTWPYWLTEFLPNMLIPYKSMFEVSCVPMASIVIDEGYALLYQADPTAHWRAVGGGSLSKGLIKLSVVRGTSMAIFLGSGYVMAEFSMKLIAKLAQSQNPVAHFLAEVLIIPSYRQAALGVLTYGGHKGITAIGLKIWECGWPESEKRAGTWDEPHLVQRGLGYLMRLVLTIPPAETIFYYLKDQNLASLAANWRFQMAMFTSIHAALWTADNYSARPRQSIENDIEAAHQPEQPSIGWQYIMPTVLMMAGYLLTEGMCFYMKALENEGYCQKDTLGARTLRFSVQIGLLMALYYTITDLMPSTKVLDSCHTLFQRLRPKPAEEKQALLTNVVAERR